MNEEITKKPTSKSIITLLAIVISFLLILLFQWVKEYNGRKPSLAACITNLKQLGLAINIYTTVLSNTYPTPEKWSDLI